MNLYKYNSKNLSYEEIKSPRYNLYFGIILFLMITGFSSVVKINNTVEKIPIIIKQQEQICNSTNVKNYIKTLNLKFPNIVYQQVILESNNFKSPVFKSLNNLLGMENSMNRPTIGINTGNRFTMYSNWHNCLIDYAIWQAYMTRDIDTEEDYYYFLDKVYCPSILKENKGELYSTRLKRIK